MKLDVDAELKADFDYLKDSAFEVVGPSKEYLRIIPKGNTLDVVVPEGVELTEAARQFISSVTKMLTMPIVDGNSAPLEYDTILFCAFRYALGRSTYVVDSVVQAIHAYWNHMLESDKRLYVKEIRDHHEQFGKIGMKVDTEQWLTIVDRYNSELVPQT